VIVGIIAVIAIILDGARRVNATDMRSCKCLQENSSKNQWNMMRTKMS
jgi:FtsZ-interacting cell division protein ZipA